MTRWFEDYVPGDVWELGEIRPSQQDIVAFAQRYDPQPFHVDPAAAADSMFGGIIASGWHTAALMMRLIVDNYLSPESSLGSPGLEHLRWPAPVRPDTPLRLRAEVIEARRSASRPDRGIVRTSFRLTDPDDVEVLETVSSNFVRVRP